jgi:hypothetical protein
LLRAGVDDRVLAGRWPWCRVAVIAGLHFEGVAVDRPQVLILAASVDRRTIQRSNTA